MKKLAALLFALAALARAQSSPTTTTLANAITDYDTQLVVASASGVSLDGILYLDHEAMRVTGINGTAIAVRRGTEGTRAWSHAAGATIYTGPASAFIQIDLYGTCTYPSAITRLNVLNGNIWQCQSGAWTLTNPGQGAGAGVWGQITGTLSAQTDLNTALGAKISSTEKGAASGVATLDGSTKIPIAQIPTGTTSSTVSLGNHNHTGTYQPLNSELTIIGALACIDGKIIKRSGGVWICDDDQTATGGGGSLGDPGANGLVYRSSLNVTRAAVAGTDYAAASHAHAGTDITSGTVPSARLPLPAVGAGGKVESKTCTGNDKISAIGTDGVPVCSTDVSAAGGSPSVGTGFQKGDGAGGFVSQTSINLSDIASADKQGSGTKIPTSGSLTPSRCVETDSNGTLVSSSNICGSGSGSSLPSMTGQAGKVLGNNGTSAGWRSIRGFSDDGTTLNPDGTVLQELDSSGYALVKSGSAAPASADCDAVAEVGRLYLRSIPPSTGTSTLYVCAQNGASTYGWSAL